jgi:hypothetical protein
MDDGQVDIISCMARSIRSIRPPPRANPLWPACLIPTAEALPFTHKWSFFNISLSEWATFTFLLIPRLSYPGSSGFSFALSLSPG